MNENELFDYLKASRFPGLIRSEGVYDSFDCLDSVAGYYIELKCRHTHYPELLIEKGKYDRLNFEAGYHGLDPWYINSTPEGIWGFDLTRVPEPAWEERLLPITTEFANAGKKIKVVGFLHTDYGLKL